MEAAPTVTPTDQQLSVRPSRALVEKTGFERLADRPKEFWARPARQRRRALQRVGLSQETHVELLGSLRPSSSERRRVGTRT